jgi:hypothetical protein
MFILNGKPLSPDVAFTDPATGVQYPANWLRLSTLEEKEAIGITESQTRSIRSALLLEDGQI